MTEDEKRKFQFEFLVYLTYVKNDGNEIDFCKSEDKLFYDKGILCVKLP